MRMVGKVCIGLLCALALGHGTQTVHGQDASSFAVDGDWRDWGRSGPGEGDEFFDVTPDSISSIDIITYGYGLGPFRREGSEGVEDQRLFAFIFRFLQAPFQDSTRTSVELFFDVSSDSTLGEATPPWGGFLPDYRIEIAGRNGGLTTEIYRRLEGNRWVASEGEDLDEVEAALAGEWLEGAVPWDALGNPGETPEDEERGYYHFRWSARTTRGGSHDYLPGGDPCCEVPWNPLEERISTIAEPQFGDGLDHMGE